MRDVAELALHLSTSNKRYRQLCLNCGWLLRCFVLVNNLFDVDKSQCGNNFSSVHVHNYWNDDQETNLLEACYKLPHNNASVGEYLAESCNVQNQGSTTRRVVLLGVVPFVALVLFRLFDGIGIRNYVERLYWSTAFSMFSIVSNFVLIDFLSNLSNMTGWPCSEYGWSKPICYSVDILQYINWALLGTVGVCWTYTTLSRRSNGFIPVRLMEMQDGPFAVNPLMLLVYIGNVVVKILYDFIYFVYVSADVKGNNNTTKNRIRKTKIVDVTGYSKISNINADVIKMFDTSSDGVSLSAVELLGSNISVMIIVLILDERACPGKNSCRNALLGGLLVNILASIWKTFMVAMRQLDMHALFSRRRRLYVSVHDKGCSHEGIRNGMKFKSTVNADLDDETVNGTTLKWLIMNVLRFSKEKCIKYFSKLLINRTLLLSNSDENDIPDTKILSTSVRMAITLRKKITKQEAIAEIRSQATICEVCDGRVVPVPLRVTGSRAGGEESPISQRTTGHLSDAEAGQLSARYTEGLAMARHRTSGRTQGPASPFDTQA